MNGPKHTNENSQPNFVQIQEPLAPEKAVAQSSATAMNLGGPLAMEADVPNEDILGSFVSDEHHQTGLMNYARKPMAEMLDKADRLMRHHRQVVIDLPDGSHAEGCHHRAMRKLQQFIRDHKPTIPGPKERIYLMD